MALKNRLYWVFVCCLFGQPALAGQIEQVQVERESNQYRLSISSQLAMPLAELQQLLTNYELVAQANPAIKSLEVESQTLDGITRIKATLRVCIWFYCRSLQQTQNMQLVKPGHLVADLIPAESDFRYGRADWLMSDHATGSHLTFSAALTPDFWVPPLIGPYVIKKKMREEAIETVLGLERLAAELNP